MSHPVLPAIAIIPARGGSKRILKKNVKMFAGMPILAYAIRVALESLCFSDVLVSSDDDEILAAAQEYGASRVMKRSTANASDQATTADAVREVMVELQTAGERWTNFCCVYPAVPLLQVDAIRSAKRVMDENPHSHGVMAVNHFQVPPNTFNLRGDLMLARYVPSADTSSERQSKLVTDAGQFYWFRTAEFLNCGVCFDRVMPFLLGPLQSHDINTPDDWLVAEAKFLWRMSQKK